MKLITGLGLLALVLSGCVKADLGASFDRIADAIEEELRGHDENEIADSVARVADVISGEIDGTTEELRDPVAMAPDLTSAPDSNFSIEPAGDYTSKRVTPSRSGTFYGFEVDYNTALKLNHWGYWLKEGNETLVRVGMTVTGVGNESSQYATEFSPRIDGTPSDTNPLRGNSTWKGKARAVSYSFHRIEGESEFTYNFGTSRINARLFNFDGGLTDFSINGMSVRDGTFRYDVSTDQSKRVFGYFYGNDHQALVGQFERGIFVGVFGAKREE